MITNENAKANEVIDELFQLILSRYLIGLETIIRGSSFIFDHVHLLYYKCHKIYPNGCGSKIDSPNWIKNKNVTINPINKNDNIYFQYAATLASNHEKLENIKK